jgi:hypothetical protein
VLQFALRFNAREEGVGGVSTRADTHTKHAYRPRYGASPFPFLANGGRDVIGEPCRDLHTGPGCFLFVFAASADHKYSRQQLRKMSDGTASVTTEGGLQFFKHFYSYMDTGRSNLKVRAGVRAAAEAPAVEGAPSCSGHARYSATGAGRPSVQASWGREHGAICTTCVFQSAQLSPENRVYGQTLCSDEG